MSDRSALAVAAWLTRGNKRVYNPQAYRQEKLKGHPWQVRQAAAELQVAYWRWRDGKPITDQDWLRWLLLREISTRNHGGLAQRSAFRSILAVLESEEMKNFCSRAMQVIQSPGKAGAQFIVESLDDAASLRLIRKTARHKVSCLCPIRCSASDSPEIVKVLSINLLHLFRAVYNQRAVAIPKTVDIFPRESDLVRALRKSQLGKNK